MTSFAPVAPYSCYTLAAGETRFLNAAIPKHRCGAVQRHQGEGGTVRLVVVEHRKVPPGAVRLLQVQQDVGQVVLEVRPLAAREADRCTTPRSNGRNSRSSRPPGTTTRAGWAACVRCRARDFGQIAGRARFSTPRRSPACRPTAAGARLHACERPRLPGARFTSRIGRSFVYSP